MSYLANAERLKPILELGRVAGEAGITAEPQPPDLPSRPGYKWEATLNGKVIVWKEVADPGAPGTQDNPIVWESGIKVYPNYWYTHDGKLYVCVRKGTPTEFTDEYFEEMEL